MRRVWRKTIWLLVGLVIIAALLYRFRGAVMLGGFNWQKLGKTLESVNIPLLILATASIYVSYAVRALRWTGFSRYMGQPRFWNVYSATIMGFAAIFLLGRAGEPVRPLLIARKDHLPIADSFGVYVLERVFDIGATAVIAICALLEIPREALPSSEAQPLIHAARLAGWTLLGLLIALIAFLIYFRVHGAGFLHSRLSGLKVRGGWRAKLSYLIRGFSEGLQAIRSPRDLIIALAYTLIHWIVVALVYLWVIHSFSGRLAELDFGAALLVLAFTMIGSMMQLPAVGGGTQLATFLVLTVILGVEKEPAAAAAIVMWLVTFAAACVVGVPLLVHEGWSMGELRLLAREEAEAEKAGRHTTTAEHKGHSREAPR
ncbi:MAG TPA: lysylphosphatidylglycerol synthase transmembrane domain-containing protein [Candidatus Acidoferrales bacterium]|nr:lysylphosphatidylglycerol synthase transmembrane domain-containing protein [Candidatus Acidoferrales bacterium]